MNITSPAQKGNLPDIKISLPNRTDDRRFKHRLPGINGLGQASIFARELHTVAPELFRRRWT